jgi:hypothetical protein
MAAGLMKTRKEFLKEIREGFKFNDIKTITNKKNGFQKYIILRYNYLKQFEGYLDSPIHSKDGQNIMKELEFSNEFLKAWDNVVDSNVKKSDFSIILKDKV